MPENASDVGFLRADSSGRILWSEGDRERWRIPFGSLVSCEIESFAITNDNTGQRFLAVLRFCTSDGIVERPVTLTHIYWGKRTARERRWEAETVQALVLGKFPEG